MKSKLSTFFIGMFGGITGALLLLVIAATSPSLYPTWTAFRGTNEVVITTNPATGRIIVGPTTRISVIASNAASANASNLVVILSGTGTTVTKTSTNGTNFYTVTMP